MNGDSFAMTSSYGAAPHHIAVIGSAAGNLDPLVHALRAWKVSVASTSTGRALPYDQITMLIIAERFEPGMTWHQWREQAEHTWALFQKALPLLALPATGLLLAYLSTDARRERKQLNGVLRDLIAGFEREAASEQGIDFTMNAISIPASGQQRLLDDRLMTFLGRRTTFANSVLIDVEDLEDQSIREALVQGII